MYLNGNYLHHSNVITIRPVPSGVLGIGNSYVYKTSNLGLVWHSNAYF